jgi:hypothetical protein
MTTRLPLPVKFGTSFAARDVGSVGIFRLRTDSQLISRIACPLPPSQSLSVFQCLHYFIVLVVFLLFFVIINFVLFLFSFILIFLSVKPESLTSVLFLHFPILHNSTFVFFYLLLLLLIFPIALAWNPPLVTLESWNFILTPPCCN